MSIHDSYGPPAQDRIKQQFDETRLHDEIRYANRDIDVLMDYRNLCLQQLDVIRQTKFIYAVKFERGYNYAVGKVDWSVAALHIPQVDGGRKYAVCGTNDCQRFTGHDKKREALAFAHELCVKYSCGFWTNFELKATDLKVMKGIPVLKEL